MSVTPQRAIDATTEYVDSLKNDVGPDSFARMIVSYTSTTYWEVSRHAVVAGLLAGGMVGLIVGMAFMLILVRT